MSVPSMSTGSRLTIGVGAAGREVRHLARVHQRLVEAAVPHHDRGSLADEAGVFVELLRAARRFADVGTELDRGRGGGRRRRAAPRARAVVAIATRPTSRERKFVEWSCLHAPRIDARQASFAGSVHSLDVCTRTAKKRLHHSVRSAMRASRDARSAARQRRGLRQQSALARRGGRHPPAAGRMARPAAPGGPGCRRGWRGWLSRITADS